MNSDPLAPIRDMMSRGKYAEAMEDCRRVLDKQFANADAHDLLARACLRTGQIEEAERASAEAVSRRPGDASFHITRGRVLNNLRRMDECVASFRQAIHLDPECAQAHHDLGRVWRNRGDLDQAQTCFERAIALDGALVSAHRNLGTVYALRKEYAAAAGCFERALEINVADAAAHHYLGGALQNLGRPAEAEGAYREALRLSPDNAVIYSALGMTLQDLSRHEEAVECYRWATKLNPRHVEARSNLANALLELQRFDEVVDACEACLAIDPGNRTALAHQAAALEATGDHDRSGRLFDLSRMLLRHTPAVPAGYSTMAAFNAAIAHHVLNHPTLKSDPHGHATRNGRHTGALFDRSSPLIIAMEQLVRNAVTHYLANRPPGVDESMLMHVPKDWKLTAWAVVMDEGGHQMGHIHPAGWISGVYYVQVPELVNDPARNHAGWIEFGFRPSTLNGADPDHLFKPEEGVMYLFPSYFCHGTVPLDEDAQRICISFDVIADRQSAVSG